MQSGSENSAAEAAGEQDGEAIKFVNKMMMSVPTKLLRPKKKKRETENLAPPSSTFHGQVWESTNV